MKTNIEIFKTLDNQVEISVQLDNETVWLNRQQIAFLFERDIKTIGKHIGNVFSEGELDMFSTVAKFATIQNEFRQSATQRLKDYIVKGYSLNEKNL